VIDSQDKNRSLAAASAVQRFVAIVRKDPKRVGTLLVLVTLLLTIWVRVFLAAGTELGPSRAGGAISSRGGASGNGSTPASSRGAVDGPGALSIGPSISPANRLVDKRLRQWLAEPLRPVGRNLFAIQLNYYPVDGSRSQGLKTSGDGEFWAKLEKSLMLQADQRDKRENLVANYTAEAGKMRLDSIMMGPQPKAMIDGKLVTEGDFAAGFRVLKIEPRRIMVEREGIRLEIQMK
jgi:hypothetical protein